MKISSKHFTPFVVLVITGGIAQAQPVDEPTTPAEPVEPTQTTDIDIDTQPAPAPAPAPVQSQPQVETNIYTAPATEMESQTWFERMGFGISAGGGIEGFTDEAMRDSADVGGNWDVRLTLGTRSPIGIEASYIGSVQSIDALGLDDDALLVGNGLQAALRVNILPNEMVQPFLYGGVAWRHYTLSREDFNTSDVLNEDDVLEIPLGVGVDYRYAGLIIDGRAEFRAATQADLVPDRFNNSDNVDLHRWGVNVNVGYEF